MKKLTSLIVAGLLATAAVNPAFSQEDQLTADGENIAMTIGSGGEGGTYYAMVNDMAKYCTANGLSINHYVVGEKSEGGSLANLKNIIAKKIDAGIVQLDVAQLRLMSKDPKMLKVQAVFQLHSEQLHILVPRIVTEVTQRTVKTKKFLGLSEDESVVEDKQQVDNVINTVDDISGKRVAAWGGSAVTAEVIRANSSLKFDIVNVKDAKEALQKMEDGEADAIFAVSGAPVQWLTELPAQKYKLIGFSEGSLTQEIKDIYEETVVTYDNMGPAGQTVNTVMVPSVLMNLQKNSAKFSEGLTRLRDCLKEKLPEIQDDGETHPAWADVDFSKEISWDNIFKPVTTAPAVVPQQ